MMWGEQKKQQEHTQAKEHTHRNPLRDCRWGQVGPCVCVCVWKLREWNVIFRYFVLFFSTSRREHEMSGSTRSRVCFATGGSTRWNKKEDKENRVRKEREEEEAKGEREEEEKRAYYTHNSDVIRTHTTTEKIPWGFGRRQLSDQSAILTLPHQQWADMG